MNESIITPAKSVSYKIGENTVTRNEAFDDAENGITWDGEGTITLSNASLDGIGVDGDAEIRFQGKNSIEHIIHSEGGSLVLMGDGAAAVEKKPVVNIGVTGATSEDRDTWGYIASSKETVDDRGELVGTTYGDICVKDLTVVFHSEFNAIEGKGVTIDGSKIAVASTADAALNIFANGEMNIAGSAVDAGTAIWNDSIGFVGYLYSGGPMAISGSAVSVRPPEGWAEADGRTTMSVSSAAGIELVDMANGDVKSKDAYSYIDTGDGNSVFLKAASTASRTS